MKGPLASLTEVVNTGFQQAKIWMRLPLHHIIGSYHIMYGCLCFIKDGDVESKLVWKVDVDGSSKWNWGTAGFEVEVLAMRKPYS